MILFVTMSCDNCILPTGEKCPIYKIKKICGESMGKWQNKIKNENSNSEEPRGELTIQDAQNIITGYTDRKQAEETLINFFRARCPYGKES